MARNPGKTALRAERQALREETARGRKLRPARFDDLGLKRALSDRLLPSLVAAMAFLAALALAGLVAAETLGGRWQAGAGSSVTVQVPQPGAAAADLPGSPNRRDAVLALLRAAPGVAAVRALSEGELSDLLRPWLGSQGDALTVSLPAVIEVQLDPRASDHASLTAALMRAAPGTLVENEDQWAARLAALARSLEASAGLAVLVVAAVAVAVVAVATRAGLVSRRAAIEIVHGLGATDRYIAGRFAGRATMLALIGGAIGAAAALPVLAGLAALAAPFTAPAQPLRGAAQAVSGFAALPPGLWFALPCLPLASGAIGWLTAQFTVRRWLKRLA
jgi:cell division transport system permease protein